MKIVNNDKDGVPVFRSGKYLRDVHLKVSEISKDCWFILLFYVLLNQLTLFM